MLDQSDLARPSGTWSGAVSCCVLPGGGAEPAARVEGTAATDSRRPSRHEKWDRCVFMAGPVITFWDGVLELCISECWSKSIQILSQETLSVGRKIDLDPIAENGMSLVTSAATSGGFIPRWGNDCGRGQNSSRERGSGSSRWGSVSRQCGKDSPQGGSCSCGRGIHSRHDGIVSRDGGNSCIISGVCSRASGNECCAVGNDSRRW